MVRWIDSVTGLNRNIQWDAAGNQRRVYTDTGYDPENENTANDPDFRFIDHLYSYDANNRVTRITQRGQDWRPIARPHNVNLSVWKRWRKKFLPSVGTKFLRLLSNRSNRTVLSEWSVPA